MNGFDSECQLVLVFARTLIQLSVERLTQQGDVCAARVEAERTPGLTPCTGTPRGAEETSTGVS